MSIIETINDEYHFWNWLKQSGSYKDNFSLEGAKAVFNYFDDLSESLGSDEPVEFDPIAWCVEFTEYDSMKEAVKELVSDDDKDFKHYSTPVEYFTDRTTVIELDNGHVILGEF